MMCVMCSKSLARACTRCGSVKYCSKECQKQDWTLHKLLCAALKPQMLHRPSLRHKLAIILPVETDQPRLIWVEWDRTNHRALLEDFLGTTAVATEVEYNDRRERILRTPVRVCYRDRFLKDGSVANRSVQVVTKGKARHNWMGPLVILTSSDVTLKDFRNAVDYLIAYGSDELTLAICSGPSPNPTVRAAVINCTGHQSEQHEPPFVDARVRIRHPMLCVPHGRPPIARLVGVPLRTYRLQKDRAYDPKYDRSNSFAALLHMETDLKSQTWGWAPFPEWQIDIGNVAVARQDLQPLDARQLECLCDFVTSIVQPIIEEALEGDRSRVSAVKAITGEKFWRHFESYRAMKAVEDSSWLAVRNPVSE